MTHCSKPSCTNIASVVLSYDYAARKVILEDAAGEISPHDYGMCLKCAERLTPPRGWIVDDRRLATPLFADRGNLDRSLDHFSSSPDVGHDVVDVERERQLFFGSTA